MTVLVTESLWIQSLQMGFQRNLDIRLNMYDNRLQKCQPQAIKTTICSYTDYMAGIAMSMKK